MCISAIRWTTEFGICPKRPEFTALIDRIQARPAFLRAKTKDSEIAARQMGK